MKLRIATPNDAAAALSIYSQYIHTPVTFEYELPPQEEFARRIGDTLKKLIKRILPEARVYSVSNMEEIEKVKEEMGC